MTMCEFKNVKLIVSDLDGTLLHNDKSLDNNIIEVLQQKDVLFTLASGRNYFVTENFVKKLNIKIPFIVNNGASIYVGKKCIFTCEINSEDLDICLKFFERFKIPFLAHSIDEAYYYLDDDRIHVLKNRLKGKCPVVEVKNCSELMDKKILKFVMFDDIDNDIKKYSNDLISRTKAISFKRTEDNMYTVNNINVDKGKALMYLLNYLGISSSDVLVFGDNFNDAPMFDVCPGVAVANSQELLKSKARYFTDSNENDGVSSFIKKVL